MATYYKYAERNADSQINWADVGKNMSDMLAKEAEKRETLKSDINKQFTDDVNLLSDPPQGNHTGAKEYALDYSSTASEYLLTLNKLLKSGDLKLRDYTVARQNLMDGTSQAFNLVNDYQKYYTEGMDRYKNGESSAFELFQREAAEKYTNLSKSQLWINPPDGKVSIAMKELQKDKDGNYIYVMNKNPNSFTTINSLKNSVNVKIDKFNTDKVTTQFAKGLGTEIRDVVTKVSSIYGAGQKVTIDSIFNNEFKNIDDETRDILNRFKKSEDNFIDGLLVNGINKASILSDGKVFADNGEQYGFTYNKDEADKNENLILVKIDERTGQNIPEFSKKQDDAAKEYIREELRAKYDSKETISSIAQTSQTRAITSTELDKEASVQTAKVVGAHINDLVTGKNQQSAANALAGYGISIKSTNGVISIEQKDGTVTTFSPKSSASDIKSGIASIVSRSESLNGVNLSDILASLGDGNKTVGEDFISEVKIPLTDEVTEEINPIEIYQNYISNVSTEDITKGLNFIDNSFNSKKEMVERLNSIFEPLGFNVSANRLLSGITVSQSGNEEVSKSFDTNKSVITLKDMNELVESAKEWMKTNPTGKDAFQKESFIEGLIQLKVIPTNNKQPTSAINTSQY